MQIFKGVTKLDHWHVLEGCWVELQQRHHPGAAAQDPGPLLRVQEDAQRDGPLPSPGGSWQNGQRMKK